MAVRCANRIRWRRGGGYGGSMETQQRLAIGTSVQGNSGALAMWAIVATAH